MHPVLRRSGFCLAWLALGLCGWAAPALAQRKPAATPKSSPTPTATPAPSPPQYVLADPVASVNGQPITRAELERVTDLLMSAKVRSLKALPAAEQKKVYRSVLDSLIVDRLISAQAANEPVEKADVEKRWDELAREYPNQAAFDDEIKRSGQTSDQVKQNIRNQLAHEHWVSGQIADQVAVTPQEVAKFYQDGPPDKFDAPEKVTASHILIKLRRDAPPEEVLTAEKKANDAIDRLNKGENFADVAMQVSDDPTVKKNKGDLGAFGREGIMPEFADAAFKLKVGEISAPVRTQFGYHIIKVTDRQPARTDTLDQASERITAYILEQKRRKATAALVQKLRDGAKIEVTDDLRDPSHNEVPFAR